MKKIKIVDQTIRDAQQSLWAYLMNSDMITPIAPVMDEVGYHHIATVGSMGFVVQLRYFNEDPWERIRNLSGMITKTPLRGSYQTASLASFDIDTPRDVIALWIKRMVANGIKAFWVCDYQSDMERFYHFAKLAKDLGTEVIPSLMYTSSPVHDDEHWARKTRLIAELKEYVDAIMIEDASGVITPERTRRLVTTVKENCEGLPLEFHSHCNSGLAPISYLEAIKAGADALHTAVAPLANGTSLPSTENIVKNARHLGFELDIDDAALEKVSKHFREIAEREGLPIGTPEEYDLFHYEHQVPGGMMTNLKRQLKEMKMEDRLDEFLEEVIQVRKDFGYPVMATPFSQIVGAQAVENVILGERYKRILDESVKYVAGQYGEPAGPIDPNFLDRIEQTPEAKKLLEWTPQNRMKSVEELRKEIGPDLTDEEFLLRVLIPGSGARKPAPAKETGEEGKKEAPTAGQPGKAPQASPMDFPREFSVEVDGDLFHVKISPVDGGMESGVIVETGEDGSKGSKETPPGAVIPMMAGMVISIKVQMDQFISKGEVLATIEAMKMIREVNAPHSGFVREICICEGDMVESGDILMVVEPGDE